MSPGRLHALIPQLLQVRNQGASERDLKPPPPELQPLDAGFIDLPKKTLEEHRRSSKTSLLGQVLPLAARFRDQVDRVIILGIGGSYLGARALFEALCHTYHNEMPVESRRGAPRTNFEGNSVDNDALRDLLDLLNKTCVDPKQHARRWGVVVISKSGGTLETAAVYRALRRELQEFYGPGWGRLRQFIVPITGATGKLRDLCRADGFSDRDVLTIPDDVGGRFSVFTPVG